MHPNARFNWTDLDAMRDFVARQSFAALIFAGPGGMGVAHAPVVLCGDTHIGFHLSRANALASRLDGTRALLLVQGPHGYVSPDWYGLADQVPTWNYVAVELEGIVRETDDEGLLMILDALSAQHESRLTPKPVWTRDKMTPGLVEKMCRAIVGFTMEVNEWRGTRKLGQPKGAAALHRAADGVEAAGNAELAALMRASLDGVEF